MAGSYKVKGAGAVFAHNFNTYQEGDVVENVPRSIALEFRHQLEPLSPEDAFPEQGVGTIDVTGMPGHEQKMLLEARKAELTAELELVNKQLSEVGKAAPSSSSRSTDAATAGIPVK